MREAGGRAGHELQEVALADAYEGLGSLALVGPGREDGHVAEKLPLLLLQCCCARLIGCEVAEQLIALPFQQADALYKVEPSAPLEGVIRVSGALMCIEYEYRSKVARQ